MGHSRLLRRLSNAPRNFIDDYIVVPGVPTQQTTETNDRVILFSLRQLPSRQRNLKRPRHPHQINILFRSAGTHQSIDCAQQEPLGDERVESGNDNSKAHTLSAQRAFQRMQSRLRRTLSNEILFFYFLRDSLPPRCAVLTYPVLLCVQLW